MPKYLVEMHDGRKFQVEADSQPTEADVLAKLGESSPAPTATVERGGLMHPLTSVVAPELEAARGALAAATDAPHGQPILARSRTGALYPSEEGTGAVNAAKAAARGAGGAVIDQTEGVTSPVGLLTAGAAKVASTLEKSPLARAAAAKLLQFVGDFDLRKPFQSTVGRAGDALARSAEEARSASAPGFPRTSVNPDPPPVAAAPADLSRVPAGSLTQEQIGERLAATNAGAVPEAAAATAKPPVGGSLADQRAAFEARVAARQAPEAQVPTQAPNAAPAPSVAAPARFSQQRAINDLGMQARRAKLTLSLDQVKALVPLVEQGQTPADVIGTLIAKDPTVALAKLPGVLSDAEVQAALDARNARGELKAPSAQTAKARRAGVQSPLTPESPTFKEWFGASEITDEQGIPTKMYHGTDQDFSSFKTGKEGAIYLTDDPDIAKDYGKTIKETYVKAHKVLDLGTDPYDFDKLVHQVHLADSDLADRVRDLSKSVKSNGVKPGIFTALHDPSVIQALKKRGFDAVQFADDHGPYQKPVVLAVFSPDQLSVNPRSVAGVKP